MSQISKSLRKTDEGYTHWCPGCKQMHPLPNSWMFNNNFESPTFQPSFLHRGVRQVCDSKGQWTGEWVKDQDGKPVRYVCHYNLTDGNLGFLSDCTHEFRNKIVPLPDLPEFYKDTDMELFRDTERNK